MKKALLLLLVLPLLARAEYPAGQTITNVSHKIASQRALRSRPDWIASTAYTQGSEVKSNFRYYMAVTGGTSGTTNPIHVANDLSDGGIVWRHIPVKKRQGITVVNDGTNALYISFSYPAISLKGIKLNGDGGAISLSGENFQESVHAVRASGTGNVTILEW